METLMQRNDTALTGGKHVSDRLEASTPAASCTDSHKLQVLILLFLHRQRPWHVSLVEAHQESDTPRPGSTQVPDPAGGSSCEPAFSI